MMANDSGADALSMRDILYVLFRRKRTIVVFFLAFVLAVAAVISLWPYAYEAHSSLLVRLGRENINLPAVGQGGPQVVTMGLRKEDINTEIEMLRSRVIAERVLKKLGVERLHPAPMPPQTVWGKIKHGLVATIQGTMDGLRSVLYALNLDKPLSREERLVQELGKRLNVDQATQSNMIDITLRWGDPETAAAILQAALDAYLELHLDSFSATGQQNFFGEQVGQLEQRIEEAEGELQRIRREQGVSPQETQQRLLEERLSAARAETRATGVEIAETSTRIAELTARLSAPKEGALRQAEADPVIAEYKKQLMTLELERRRVDTKYRADSVTVQNLDQAIAEVRQRLLAQDRETIERQIQTLNTQMEVLQTKAKTQARQVDALEANLRTVNDYGVEIRKLQRQIKNDEESYQLYRHKLEEARISGVLDRERFVNVTVVQPVAASEKPVAPRKVLVAAIGVVAGLVLAVGIAFLLHYFDASVRNDDDVVHLLGLRYLGSVSEWR